VSDAVRTSAKAIVVQHDRILLIKHVDENGSWYGLPGGGQEHGETLEEAVRRECLEEVGVQVRIGRLLFVRDYIGKHHEFAEEDRNAHQVEVMFDCELSDGAEATLGSAPDPTQVGIAWFHLQDLPRLRLYPKVLALLLTDGLPDDGAYLGDVN